MTFIAVVLLGAGVVLLIAGIENQPITATIVAFFNGTYIPTPPAPTQQPATQTQTQGQTQIQPVTAPPSGIAKL